MSASSRPPSQRSAALVMSAAVFVYFVAVTHRTSLGVAGVEAINRFGVEASGLAVLSVAQIATYALMQIPAGRLLDRWGPRVIMIGGALLMATGQAVLALTDHMGVALGARILIGAGDAPIFIGAARLIAYWFPPRRVPFLMQITGLVGQAGQLASALPIAWLLHAQGWSPVFATLAAVGVGSAVVAAVGIRVPHETEAQPVVATRERFWQGVRAATKPAGTRLGFWSHFVTPFSANVVGLLWGVPFFVTAQGRSPANASLLLVVLTASAMIAGPTAGVLTGRHPMRRSWIVLGSAGATAIAWLILLSFSTPRPMWQLAVFVAVIGAGGPISLVGMDFARSYTPAERLGTATGFVNVGGFTSTIVGVLAVGLVLQLVSPAGATTYTLDEYRIAFSVLAIPWLVGVVGVVRHRRLTRAMLAQSGVVVPPIREAIRRQWRRN